MVNKEAERLSQEIIDSLELPNRLSSKPIVLMIGGFQGSGKTTVINSLKDDFGLVVVSLDEIRQKMFDKGFDFDEKFREIVKVTGMKLLKYLFQRGYSVAWDTNVTPVRIKEVEELLESENLINYDLVKIYFETSKKELIKRLNNRSEVSGRYKGTVNELEESIKKDGKVDKSIYDLVINTERLDIQAILKVMKKKLMIS